MNQVKIKRKKNQDVLTWNVIFTIYDLFDILTYRNIFLFLSFP